MPDYEKLGYVALNVTDPDRSADFYEKMVGLSWMGRGASGEVYLRCTAEHHNLVLHRSESVGLKRLGFEMRSDDDLKALAESLAVRGLPVQELDSGQCAELRQGPGFRTTEPFTGTTLEFYNSMEKLGDRPFVPTVAKIQRLGHVVLKSPRLAETIDFYLGTLGFLSSDVIEGRVCFMRCPPNPYHHSLGLGAANRAGLHHLNFMVSEIDDVGKAINRFRKNGVDIVAGPGRHPPSDSIFLYFLDPDGLTVEYSLGMEEFPVKGARAPRLFPARPESLDYWGGERDSRHGSRGVIERLDVVGTRN